MARIIPTIIDWLGLSSLVCLRDVSEMVRAPCYQIYPAAGVSLSRPVGNFAGGFVTVMVDDWVQGMTGQAFSSFFLSLSLALSSFSFDVLQGEAFCSRFVMKG